MADKNHIQDDNDAQGSKEKADATHNEEMMLMVKRAGGGNIKDEVSVVTIVVNCFYQLKK